MCLVMGEADKQDKGSAYNTCWLRGMREAAHYIFPSHLLTLTATISSRNFTRKDKSKFQAARKGAHVGQEDSR